MEVVGRVEDGYLVFKGLPDYLTKYRATGHSQGLKPKEAVMWAGCAAHSPASQIIPNNYYFPFRENTHSHTNSLFLLQPFCKAIPEHNEWEPAAAVWQTD